MAHCDDVPAQTGLADVMLPGMAGSKGVSVRHPAALLQPLSVAVQHTLPLLQLPKLTVMEFSPCPEVMVAPVGTVQLNMTPGALGVE
jgi:hypothetical protein